MTAKRFELNEPFFKQIDANSYIIIPILDNGKEISVGELVELLNELHEENQSLKSKHMEMLDFIEEKGTVTVNDIKQWWNTTR